MHEGSNGRQLLKLSDDMVLGTNVVLFLCRQEGQEAGLEDIATGLGTSHDKVWRQVSRLVRHGIVACENGADSRLSLSAKAKTLTLADIARATDGWLDVPVREEDNGIDTPGLPHALSLVRERVLADLGEMNVFACAWTAEMSATDKKRRQVS